MQHLPNLAQKFLDAKEYDFLRIVADMMVGFSSDGWTRLGDEEREYYLKDLKTKFHPRYMGESQSCWGNPDYENILETIDGEYRALTRKMKT